jgi:hypothetical protein
MEHGVILAVGGNGPNLANDAAFSNRLRRSVL